MSLIGHHTLNPTTDADELVTRLACATDNHPATTYNPVHDATWCRCGAVVIAGDHGVTPRYERVTGEAPLHRRYIRVLGGSLNDWVGVADAPLEDFTRGVVDGRNVEADDQCTYDCPCQHAVAAADLPPCAGCGAELGEECFPFCMSALEV